MTEITNPDVCYKFLRSKFSINPKKEILGVISLTNEHMLIETHIINIGEITDLKALVNKIDHITSTEMAEEYIVFHIYPPGRMFSTFNDIDLSVYLLGDKFKGNAKLMDVLIFDKEVILSYAAQGLGKGNGEFKNFILKYYAMMEMQGIGRGVIITT